MMNLLAYKGFRRDYFNIVQRPRILSFGDFEGSNFGC